MSNETIGPKIKEFRKKNKITQDQLAESLGYSGKSVISHIEKGDADMTYEKILLLIRKYMIDANELFAAQEVDQKIYELRKDKTIVTYIHGLYGSQEEVKYIIEKSRYIDVVGLEYQDGNPWEVKDKIRDEFIKLTKDYKQVVVVANSIGAFYTYTYLDDLKIDQAYFISPVVDMVQIIKDLMLANDISEDDLKLAHTIICSNGQTLNYEFYQFVQNYQDNWNVPTEILYGTKDELVDIKSIVQFLENHPLSELTIKRESSHYFHTDEERAFIKEWISTSLLK